MRSIVTALAIAACAVLPASTAEAQASPLAQEIAELKVAPVSHAVLYRLEQINDSLAVVELALEQRLECLKRGPFADCSRTSERSLGGSGRTHGAGGGATIALLGSVGAGYLYGRARPDAGGYVDTWGSIDKEAHAASCAAVYAGLRAIGAPKWVAFALPMVGGLALEYGQSARGGHFSGKDIGANAAGCSAALLVDVIR